MMCPYLEELSKTYEGKCPWCGGKTHIEEPLENTNPNYAMLVCDTEDCYYMLPVEAPESEQIPFKVNGETRYPDSIERKIIHLEDM